MTILQELGEQVKLFRKRMGFTQEQLAAKAGITPSFLGQIERGQRSPTVETVYKISKALEVSMEELFSFQKEIIQKDAAHVYHQRIMKLLKSRNEKDLEFTYQLLKQLFKLKDAPNV